MTYHIQRSVDAISTKSKSHDARFKNSVGSDNLPSQTIPNPKGGNASVRITTTSPIQQLARPIPLSIPTQTSPARKSTTDEDLLKMFKKIPKYAKFLKELCIHKRKKIKGVAEMGGVMSMLAQNEGSTARSQ
ncbi:hypothetical protein CR513_26078, partial [Mucuna pruriens]